MKNLIIIAAVGKDLELGYNNDLIWHIKEDLEFFKQKTNGAHIIMGSKTYQSLPKKLPNRKYIVLTDTNEKYDNDIQVFNNLEETLNFVKEQPENIYVIGGGQIYKLFLPHVDTMHLTEIDSSSPADVYFPTFDKNNWGIEKGEPLTDKGIDYAHVLYKRKTR